MVLFFSNTHFRDLTLILLIYPFINFPKVNNYWIWKGILKGVYISNLKKEFWLSFEILIYGFSPVLYMIHSFRFSLNLKYWFLLLFGTTNLGVFLFFSVLEMWRLERFIHTYTHMHMHTYDQFQKLDKCC